MSIRNVAVGATLILFFHLTTWAQSNSAERDLPSAPSQSGEQNSSGSGNHHRLSLQNPFHATESKGRDPYELEPGADPENHLIFPFAKHLAEDQYHFWTAPAHFQFKDMEWIAPFAGITAGFMAGDSWVSKQIPLGEVSRSKTFSNYATYSLIGAGAGSFLLGHLNGDDHMSEAGLLSGEAAINSTAVSYLLKTITQRPRPYQANGNGSFFQGGSSFPSEHSAIAWSIASVMAHEYPGTLTKLLAYGLATGISATRVTGQQHFASDVIVGSALGWYFGRQVYRAHHDSDLAGDAWGTFLPDNSGEKTRNPENMGSPDVPLDSWVYPALERLIALGYIKTAYLGIRPWTRMECARMLEEVEERIGDEDAENSNEAVRIYKDLSDEFTTETRRLDGAESLGASLDSVYTRVTQISGSPLRDGYHFGQTIINDYGRPYGQGFNSVDGITAHAEAGPFAFDFRGEYQEAPSIAPYTTSQLQALASADLLPSNASEFPVNTSSISQFQLVEGSVSFNVRNLQFSFGRQSAWLGPTETGPFLFSNNAPPVTMFRMDTPSPFEFPLLSRLFGPARVEFFLGRLSGQEWVNSPPTLYGPYPADQPFIMGNKISFHPTENLEFGADFTAIFAGAGVPLTFREFFRTYYAHTQLSNNPGKRFSAFDFTYRVPRFRDWLSFYLDSLVVDEYSPISSSRASVNPGFYMPRVPKIPKLQLRAEGIREALTNEFAPGYVYIDSRYLSGYTNQGYLIGDWIGRAGWGGQGWATYSFTSRNQLQFSYRAQRVSHQFLEGGSLNDFSAKWSQTFKSQFELSATAQYENWRFPLLQPSRQNNFSTMLQLTYRPQQHFHRK